MHVPWLRMCYDFDINIHLQTCTCYERIAICTRYMYMFVNDMYIVYLLYNVHVPSTLHLLVQCTCTCTYVYGCTMGCILAA